MSRIVATSNLAFYADPVSGSTSNDGLSALTPLPEIQDAVALLYSDYDLNEQFTATIHAAAGTYAKGISLSGRLPGQRTPANLKITGAGPTGTVIVPTAYWNTNGIPNQLAIWLEHIGGGAQPHWWDAFLDIANSNCNIQNIDYNGWNGAYTGTGPSNATGYRLRLRSGGVCNLNALGVGTLPGSADTAWPYQGYVL